MMETLKPMEVGGPQRLKPIVDTVELTPTEVPSQAVKEHTAMKESQFFDTTVQEELDAINKPERPLPDPQVDPFEVAEEAFIETVLGSTEDTYQIRRLKETIETGNRELVTPQVKLFMNLDILDELNQRAIEDVNPDRSTFERITDGIDYFVLRGFTLGVYEDVIREGESFGEEILQAATTMNPKEFREFYSTKVEESKSQGFFTSENLNAIENRAATSRNFGVDPQADVMQIMGILDVATLFPAFKVLKAVKLKKLMHRDPVQQGVSSSPKGSAKASNAAVSNGKAPQNPQALTSAGPSAVNPQAVPSVNTAPLAKAIQQKSIVRNITDNFRRSFTSEDLASVLATRLNDLGKKTNSQVLNQSTAEVRPNVFVSQVELGTAKGVPFTSQGNATTRLNKLKEEFPESQLEVVGDASEGFRVRISEGIKTTDTNLEVDVPETNLLSSTVGRLIGSSRFNDDSYLNAVASFNEGVVARGLNLIEKEFSKVIKPLSKTDKRTTNAVLEKLWNGDHADQKVWYSPSEFSDEFSRAHPEGLRPSPQVMKAYEKTQDASDSAAVLSALSKLRKAVDLGYTKLVSSGLSQGSTKGKVFRGNLKAEDTVVDLKNGLKFLTAKEKASGSFTVYRLAEPMNFGGKSVKFVTNPDDIKLLDLDDVMGYNAGPRRQNPNGRFFITSGKKTPRAFMTAFSRKQALKGQEEIQTLQDAARSRTLTDDLVSKNNSWNTSVQTVGDFQKFFKDNSIDPEDLISFKERDGIIEDADFDLHFGDTWDSFFMSRQTRGNVILEYGGEPTYNTNATQAIADQLGQAAYGFAFNGATIRSKAAFARLIQENPSLVSIPKGTDLKDYDKVFANTKITGRGRVAERMRAFQQAIRNRTNLKTPVDTALERIGDEAIDYIFDKTSLKVKGSKGDVQNQILKFNFHSTMGFFNVSQFVMQGFQAATIVAVSPFHGFKASGIASQTMLLADMANNTQMFNLAVRKLAKSGLVSEDAIKASVDYIRTSGRDVFDGTSIEKGTWASMGLEDLGPKGAIRSGAEAVGSGVSKVAEVGLYPFKKGEIYSRRTGIITAHLEADEAFKTKGHVLYGKTFKDDVAQTWITDREQKLTLNMNNVGRSMLQQGVFKIPAQWTSYTFRVFENVAFGRGLTLGERGRMAMLLGPMMGLGYLPAWMGGKAAVEHLSEYLGAEPGDPAFTTIQYGIFDGMLDYVGSDLRVSSRLSYPKGLSDMISKFTGEGTFTEAVGGPTASITSGAVASAYKSMVDTINGRPTLATEDGITALRSVSAINNAEMARGILQDGFFRSRNGTKYSWEMDTWDAAIMASGFRTEMYNELLEARNYLYYSEKEFRDKRRELTRMVNKASDLLKSEDPEEFNRGSSMWRELNDVINLDAKMTQAQKQSIRKSALNPQVNIIEDTLKRLIEMGQNSRAEAIRSSLQESLETEEN